MKPTAKKQKQAHIIALFGAMINKSIVFNGDSVPKIINRMDLEGNCDLFSPDVNEVTDHDIDPIKITLKL